MIKNNVTMKNNKYTIHNNNHNRFNDQIAKNYDEWPVYHQYEWINDYHNNNRISDTQTHTPRI